MFRYVTDVSKLAHHIIQNFCSNFEVAVDATLGNGHDTDFLSDFFMKVYSFDIQKSAIDKYALKRNPKVELVCDSHENFEKHIKNGVDCIIYNLGFMPGGDKSITTQKNSTMISLNSGVNLLNKGGIVTIALYSGHEEGSKEFDAVLSWAKSLPKNEYGVLLHTFVNRMNNPPALIIIEKK